VLHGFGRYFDEKGRLKEVANHQNGVKTGTCWKINRGGGCVVGRANKEGDLTGHRIAYLYPDFKTALVGSFVDGVMEYAHEAELKTTIDDRGIKVPIFTEPKGEEYVLL
jgi:histone-lysine N-methyltransferase SETD7